MAASKDILNVQEKLEYDDSIKSYQYAEYRPITGSQLNTSGQIIITIENTDDFYYPRGSYLLIEGQLKKADGDPYINADAVTLTNNAPMYLFTNIKYSLNGTEIESLNHPGVATTMLGSLKYSDDFTKGPGLMQCWYPDTTTAAAAVNVGYTVRHGYIVEQPNPKGSFSFAVPLTHILGFGEDYSKVMSGMRHTLTLTRTTSDDDAIFRLAAADAGKVQLTKLAWMMPKVQPNDELKYKLYKTIESKDVLDVGFRMRQCDVNVLARTTSTSWRLGVKTAPEKPRFVIVGLQTDKFGNQTHNASLFDHCQVTDMSVVLNSEKYPNLNANANFSKNQFSSFYKEMSGFLQAFYGADEVVTSAAINPSSYKQLTPLFVFDVSKQSERLDTGVVDITIEMQFSANVPPNTRAYALIISDRRLKLQSDGKKMNVLF